MEQENLQVLGQKQLAPNIYQIDLTGALLGKIQQPGQFLHLKPQASDLLLRRPISIARYDTVQKTASLIYRVEGAGTKGFTTLKAGDVLDTLGPLGHGFPVDNVMTKENIFVIGGGIGIPPLYELTRQLTKRGANVYVFLGYASAQVMYYQAEFAALTPHLAISTDDGSYGQQGHVGQLFMAALAKIQPDAVYACGAKGLLQMVDGTFHDHPRAYVSLESRMACGIGACYGCVTHLQNDPTGTQSKKICDQGPVFHTGEVVI